MSEHSFVSAPTSSCLSLTWLPCHPCPPPPFTLVSSHPSTRPLPSHSLPPGGAEACCQRAISSAVQPAAGSDHLVVMGVSHASPDARWQIRSRGIWRPSLYLLPTCTSTPHSRRTWPLSSGVRQANNDSLPTLVCKHTCWWPPLNLACLPENPNTCPSHLPCAATPSQLAPLSISISSSADSTGFGCSSTYVTTPCFHNNIAN